MKKLIVIGWWLIVGGSLFAQMSISTPIDTTYINPADSANSTAYYTDSLSNPVDMWKTGSRLRLTGIFIENAMIGDTIYIQTAEQFSASDTTFTDAYYTKSDGTRVQMHIPVLVGARIGINPLWSDALSRFIRYRVDAADTNTDRKIITFGE